MQMPTQKTTPNDEAEKIRIDIEDNHLLGKSEPTETLPVPESYMGHHAITGDSQQSMSEHNVNSKGKLSTTSLVAGKAELRPRNFSTPTAKKKITRGDPTAPIKEKAALLSQDTAITQPVEIKAGQDILHLFIVLLVLGVDLQNEVIGHPETLGIGRQDLHTLSTAPTKGDHFVTLHRDRGDQGVSRIPNSTGQQVSDVLHGDVDRCPVVLATAMALMLIVQTSNDLKEPAIINAPDAPGGPSVAASMAEQIRNFNSSAASMNCAILREELPSTRRSIVPYSGDKLTPELQGQKHLLTPHYVTHRNTGCKVARASTTQTTRNAMALVLCNPIPQNGRGDCSGK